MAASYPAGLPSFDTHVDGVDYVMAADVNDLGLEVIALATELGINVAGDQTDLVTRLAVSINDNGTIKLTALAAHTGIADDNLVEVDGSPNDTEMAVWTPAGMDGKTYAELIALWRAAGVIGIGDNDILEVDGTIADNDILRATAAGVEGLTYAETRTALALVIGTNVLAQQAIGISDNDLLEVDGTVAVDDIMQATASGLKGLTYPELVALLDGAADWDFADHDLHNLKQVDFQDEHDDGNSTGTATIDWNEGNNHKTTMTGACTFTFTAPAGPCHVQLKMTAGGTHAPTWPAAVRWPAGTEPSWTAGIDIIGFWYDGANYDGVASLAFA